MALFMPAEDDYRPIPTHKARAFQAQERLFWRKLKSSPSFHDNHCASCHRGDCPSCEECPMVECPLLCDARMHACKLDEHESLVCRFAFIDCLNSGNGCPVRTERWQMSQHLATCPAALVVCNHSWYGTNTSIRESSLQVPPLSPNTLDCLRVYRAKCVSVDMGSPSSAPFNVSANRTGDKAFHPLDSAIVKNSTARCLGNSKGPDLLTMVGRPATCTVSGRDTNKTLGSDEEGGCACTPCDHSASVHRTTASGGDLVSASGAVDGDSDITHPYHRFMCDDIQWSYASWQCVPASLSVGFTMDPTAAEPRVAFQCCQVFRRSEYGMQVDNISKFFSRPPVAVCPMSRLGCTFQTSAVKLDVAGSSVFPLCTSTMRVVLPEQRMPAEDFPNSNQSKDCGSYLLSLPMELLQLILSSCDSMTLRLLSLTCRSMRMMCYHLLLTHGMVICPWERSADEAQSPAADVATGAPNPAQRPEAAAATGAVAQRRTKWSLANHYVWSFSNGVSPLRGWSSAFRRRDIREHIKSHNCYERVDHAEATESFKTRLEKNRQDMLGHFSKTRLKGRTVSV